MMTCSRISLFSLFASVKNSLVLFCFGEEVSLNAAFLRRVRGEWKSERATNLSPIQTKNGTKSASRQPSRALFPLTPLALKRRIAEQEAAEETEKTENMPLKASGSVSSRPGEPKMSFTHCPEAGGILGLN